MLTAGLRANGTTEVEARHPRERPVDHQELERLPQMSAEPFLGGAHSGHFVISLTQKLSKEPAHRARVVDDQGSQGLTLH
jgi:hypothetical protein